MDSAEVCGLTLIAVFSHSSHVWDGSALSLHAETRALFWTNMCIYGIQTNSLSVTS